MKRIQSFVGAIALAVALSATALPQNAPADHQEKQGGREGRHADHLAAMQEQLKLTPEQVAKIKPILEEQRTKMQALRSEAQQGSDREAIRTKMQAIRTETAEKIKPILTAEQLTQWNAMQERGGKRGGGWRKQQPQSQQQ
ncbi:MAG TPA: hypothetical protein VE621_20235 [Bryobacteraceae bacterium]|nr:hypothetical protein [Bryobacteraceae bacterium]